MFSDVVTIDNNKINEYNASIPINNDNYIQHFLEQGNLLWECKEYI